MNAPTLTLKELLRLTFAEPPLWLSGEAGAPPRVAWVALAVAELRPGDLLLLAAGTCAAHTLQQAAQAGAAAVLLLGELTGVDFKPDLPVLQVNGAHDLRNVYRTLLTILVNQRAYLMERGVRIHARLSQLEAEGQGLDGLAQAMGEISGRGVLVQDKRLQILASCSSAMLGAIWAEVIASLMAEQSLPEAWQDRKHTAHHGSILHQAIPGGLARRVTPIVVGGVTRGYLSLVSLAQDFDTLDDLVLEQGALVCAVEMARAKAVREAEKRLKGDLLSALLTENLTPRDTHLWMQRMGLELARPHTALRFAWAGVQPPSLRRLETLVNGEVARLGLAILVEAMGSEVVCICELPTPGRPELALKLGETVLARAGQEYPQQAVHCGVGLPAAEISAWRNSFRQAGQALEMARRLGESRALYFPDLSVYRLLLQLEHHPELTAFRDEILGSLLAYDGGEQLITTLEAYFEHNGNLSQAAEALFVHRNTLIYRMERIAEISGLDLDHTETRLAIQLALHIYRMLG